MTGLEAVVSISPLSYTEKVSGQLDEERRSGVLRGPLHGIPMPAKASRRIPKPLHGC